MKSAQNLFRNKATQVILTDCNETKKMSDNYEKRRHFLLFAFVFFINFSVIPLKNLFQRFLLRNESGNSNNLLINFIDTNRSNTLII